MNLKYVSVLVASLLVCYVQGESYKTVGGEHATLHYANFHCYDNVDCKRDSSLDHLATMRHVPNADACIIRLGGTFLKGTDLLVARYDKRRKTCTGHRYIKPRSSYLKCRLFQEVNVKRPEFLVSKSKKYFKKCWRTFQRRVEFSQLSFDKNWQDYRYGFGNVNNNYWMGLDEIHKDTSEGKRPRLRIEMMKWDGKRFHVEYNHFYVNAPNTQFTLHISAMNHKRSTPGMKDALAYHNGQKFTVKDRDNDQHSKFNCATHFSGGWWYKSCFVANPNGRFIKGGHHKAYATGIDWQPNFGYHYSMKRFEMMYLTELRACEGYRSQDIMSMGPGPGSDFMYEEKK